MLRRTRNNRASRGRGKAIGLLLLMALATCGGCLGRGASPGARPSPRTDPLDEPASRRTLEAPIPTLAALLPRAFDRLGWARLRVDNEITALHAAALSPDGRTIHVRAQSTADGGSRVQVRAGHFGDAAVERRFLDALSRIARRAMKNAAKE